MNRRPPIPPRTLLVMPAVTAAALLLSDPLAAQEPAPGEGVLHFVRVEGSPVTTDRASSGGAVWLDVEPDGDVDLFVANGYDVSAAEPRPQANRLYLNDGSGRFTPAVGSLLHADSGFSSGAAAADFDRDGDLDLLVPNQQGQDQLLYRNDGGGAWSLLGDSPVARSGGATFSGSFGDLDGDGYPEIVLSNGGLSGFGQILLYRNVGGERFEEWPVAALADSARGLGQAFVDVDGDGDVDLVLPGRPGHALRNDGGRLVEVTDADGTPPLDFPSFGSVWGDYDNDGDFDVFLPRQATQSSFLYRNDGDWRFTRLDDAEPSRDLGGSLAATWADLDDDGHLDLVVSTWSQPYSLYRNRGDGTFEPAVTLPGGPAFGAGITTADVDGDGDLDLYAHHWPNQPGPGEENRLYRNETEGGRSLRIDLVAADGAALPTGTVVRVTARIAGRSVTQLREARSLEGWRGQSEGTLHFGMGDAARADRVEVVWPSGTVDTLRDVATGRVLTIREGRGAG